MTSTSTDNRDSPSTTEKDIENGASKIETIQDVVENRDEGQTAVDNIEEAADTNDNDDGKIV